MAVHRLISRNGHRFASFSDLEKLISAGLPDTRAVLDGEICSLDKHGRPQFRNLLFHRGNYPCFLAFDLLVRDGKDCRRKRLLDRKQELRRVLSGSDARIQYVDYVDGAGIPLFEQICKHDLEGIVAKQKHAPYVTDREASTWFKIRNPHYLQWAGREKLFERERNREPVAGWHSCVIACSKLEAIPRHPKAATEEHDKQRECGSLPPSKTSDSCQKYPLTVTLLLSTDLQR